MSQHEPWGLSLEPLPRRQERGMELLCAREGRTGSIVLSETIERAPELIVRRGEAVERLRGAAETVGRRGGIAVVQLLRAHRSPRGGFLRLVRQPSEALGF